MCSKPVFFVVPGMFLSNSSKFGYPFGLNFEQYIAIISNLIFKHKKYKRSESQLLLSWGCPGHITEEGATRRHPGDSQETPKRLPRDTQETPRRHQETPRRLPGDNQETPGDTQETPGGTQRHPGCIQEDKKLKTFKMLIFACYVQHI